MSKYRVLWGLNIEDAPSPYHAALEALRVQRDPESIASVFVVDDLETGEQYMIDVDAEKLVSFVEH